MMKARAAGRTVSLTLLKEWAKARKIPIIQAAATASPLSCPPLISRNFWPVWMEIPPTTIRVRPISRHAAPECSPECVPARARAPSPKSPQRKKP